MKTRMHEILGVEPYELFRIDANNIDANKDEFYINHKGDLMQKGWRPPRDRIAVYVINNPDCIIRRPRYTPEQVEQLKALKVLGMGKWWLAKDGNGDVYTYKRKPKKDSTVWDYYDENGTNAYIPMTTSLVSWSDPEPLSIAQALRDAEVEA